jgi:hypothetical protein
MLDRLHDQKLGQTIGRVAFPAHERERDRGAPVGRDEVEEAANLPAVVGGGDHERLLAVWIAERVHRHGEPALGRATTPVGRDLLEAAESVGVERAELGDRCAVARTASVASTAGCVLNSAVRSRRHPTRAQAPLRRRVEAARDSGFQIATELIFRRPSRWGTILSGGASRRPNGGEPASACVPSPMADLRRGAMLVQKGKEEL